MSDLAVLPLLKEPPLVEVLYGLQAVTSPAVTKEHVRSLVDATMAKGYTIEDMNRVQVMVNAQADGRSVHEQDMEWGGCKAVSTDKKQVVHLMREGLFVSFLPPYLGFPECIEEVQRHWELYQRCFAPQQLVRIGIRYINVLKIPMVDGSVRFDEFFKLLTFYPLEGPFQLHRFHHQFEVSELEFGLPARVIFTSTKETRDELEVVLDIEAYEELARQPQDPEIWDRFDRARHWAYKLFTNTLTESCFQRYQ
jgi:uncharacterized protein (TIGR04255 family)